MWSADMMVERRWATTRVVRPAISLSRAPCTSLSDSLSSALVASSNNSTYSKVSLLLLLENSMKTTPGTLDTMSFDMASLERL